MHRSRLPAALAVLLAAAPLTADDWPQWMGPNRDGVWRETGIVEKFPEGGPQVRWRVPLGAGYSGPAVAGGKLYVMDRAVDKAAGEKKVPEGGIARGGIPGTERVLCVDAQTGKTAWEFSYGCTYKISYPAGPRCTPVVDGGKVYCLGAMGELHCLDAGTGKVVWAKKLLDDYNLKAPPVWGYAATPLIEGDLLVTLAGGEGSAAVALDKHTGKEVWRALTAEEVGYAPPVAFGEGDRRQVLIWHPDGVAGLEPKTGKALWTLPYPTEGKPQRPEVTITMPRVEGDKLFLSSFYQGATMVRLDPAGPKVLWDKKGKNLMKADQGLHSVMSTAVLKDGHVYGVCGFGELRCLKADTGERVWETYAATGGKRGFFATAFVVENAGRYFLFNDQGDLIIAKLSPAGYEEVSRAHLIDPSQAARGRDVVWCHPAFAGRCVYVRNDKELACAFLGAGG